MKKKKKKKQKKQKGKEKIKRMPWVSGRGVSGENGCVLHENYLSSSSGIN